jgi:hypothetical protein
MHAALAIRASALSRISKSFTRRSRKRNPSKKKDVREFFPDVFFYQKKKSLRGEAEAFCTVERR